MTRAAEPVSSPEPFSLHLLSTRARRHPAWAAVLFAIMRCRASPDHHNPAIGIEHEQLPVILDVQRKLAGHGTALSADDACAEGARCRPETIFASRWKRRCAGPPGPCSSCSSCRAGASLLTSTTIVARAPGCDPADVLKPGSVPAWPM